MGSLTQLEQAQQAIIRWHFLFEKLIYENYVSNMMFSLQFSLQIFLEASSSISSTKTGIAMPLLGNTRSTGHRYKHCPIIRWSVHLLELFLAQFCLVLISTVPNNDLALLTRWKILWNHPKRKFEDGLPLLLERKFKQQVDVMPAVPLGLRERGWCLTYIIQQQRC